MPRARLSPEEEYFLLGPVRRWTTAHVAAFDATSAAIGGAVHRLPDRQVAARLPVEPLDGANRWRWLAAALSRPTVVGTPSWRQAAIDWQPSLEGGTVRVITEARYKELIS